MRGFGERGEGGRQGLQKGTRERNFLKCYRTDISKFESIEHYFKFWKFKKGEPAQVKDRV